MKSISRPLTAILALLTGSLLVGGCQPSQQFVGSAVEPPQEAPEIGGVNWDGTPFQLSDHRGEVALLFFGYTFCPDVCPLTLAKMKQVYTGLGEAAEEVAVVFVSVDPDRDTVEKLSQYVPNFDERFYGLHLTAEELRALQDELGLVIQYGQPKEGPGTDSFYYVDHTGTYFLVDREGSIRVRHPPTATADAVQADIETLLES